MPIFMRSHSVVCVAVCSIAGGTLGPIWSTGQPVVHFPPGPHRAGRYCRECECHEPDRAASSR